MPAGDHDRYHLATPGWRLAHQVSSPAPGEVHVWRFPLRAAPSTLPEYFQLLSPDERARASKFHYPQDRDHFVKARANLRQLLATYLGVPPASLAFRYSDYGKPALAMATSLTFNLSHAGAYALLGVTQHSSIGIDLEPIDATIELERLTARFFSLAEARQVLGLPAAERPAAFFRTWTRKEAFLKAHGQGLSLPLDQFSVTVDLQAPLQLDAIDWAPGTEANWALASFMVQADLPAAVVVEGKIEQVFFYDASGWVFPT